MALDTSKKTTWTSRAVAQLALMQGIKSVLDPKGILNPGKIFPDAS